MGDSSEYDMASGYLYEGTAKWGNESIGAVNAWSEPAQFTSTWQDNYLPDESSERINQGSSGHNTDTEDAAPEDINEEGVGLMIEEDDIEETELVNSSSSSTEGI